ncbi:hypothetical protein P3S67_007830 [Capsicum chacoense]
MEVKGMGKIIGYNESCTWIDDIAASLMNRTATTTFSSLEPSKSLLIPNFGLITFTSSKCWWVLRSYTFFPSF